MLPSSPYNFALNQKQNFLYVGELKINGFHTKKKKIVFKSEDNHHNDKKVEEIKAPGLGTDWHIRTSKAAGIDFELFFLYHSMKLKFPKFVCLNYISNRYELNFIGAYFDLRYCFHIQVFKAIQGFVLSFINCDGADSKLFTNLVLCVTTHAATMATRNLLYELSFSNCIIHK